MTPPTTAASSSRMAISSPVLRIALHPGPRAAQVAVGADHDEAVAHGGNNRVSRVPCGGGRADDDNAPGPRQCLAAIGADIALPATIINFPNGREHAGAGISIR